MKTELTIKQLYYNSSIMNFFFRTQAENTFNELIEKCTESNDEIFNAIENYSDDLDEVEELFYNDSIDEIANKLGLTIEEATEKAFEQKRLHPISKKITGYVFDHVENKSIRVAF